MHKFLVAFVLSVYSQSNYKWHINEIKSALCLYALQNAIK